MSSHLKFVSEKVKGYPFAPLLFLEIQSLLLCIGALVSTRFGVLPRGMSIYALAKRRSAFASLQPRVTVIHSDRITFPKNFAVTSDTYFNDIGRLTFGDFVLIGTNVTISSGRHAINCAHPEVNFAQVDRVNPSLLRRMFGLVDVW